MDDAANPWHLDELPLPPQEETKMPDGKKKDASLFVGFVCIAGLGLAGGLFVAAFLIPIKLVGWWLG